MEAPASVAITINPLSDQNDLRHQMKTVCKQLLSGWSDLPDADIEVAVISGGISNALYKLAPSSLSPVAFRIYGIGTDKFVDRLKEVETMQILYKNGFGAQVQGLFQNGRIETFLPMRCLTPEEMCTPEIALQIAAKLAKFHQVDAENAPTTAATPFTRIREWLSIAKTLDFADDVEKHALYQQFDFEELEKEVAAVEAAAAPFQSPLVFAHSDLLSGNIMVQQQQQQQQHTQTLDNTTTSSSTPLENGEKEETTPTNKNENEFGHRPSSSLSSSDDKEMTFIDFEYADWAPRGFDIGNHFCEYAGFDCDYERYPNNEAASKFMKAYLHATAMSSTTSDDDATTRVISDKQVEMAVADANVHALAAHQFWGTWAIMQARWSRIEFDYMGYAVLRWGEYRKRRDEFLEQAKRAVAVSGGEVV